MKPLAVVKPLTFRIDVEACTGCRTCMLACRDKHDPGIRLRRVYEFAGGRWEVLPDGTYTQNVFSFYLSVGCNHCLDPACIDACPAGAVERDETGIVFIDAETCVGCRSCEAACPYFAPQFDPDAGTMTKCDFCRDDLARGLPPACVAACPTRALSFGEFDPDDGRQDYRSAIGILPGPDLTRPCLGIRLPEKLKAIDTEGLTAANPED